MLPFIATPTARAAAFLLYVIAAVTDYWDGHLARTRGLVTDLGRLLDPLADKLLLIATLVPMYALQRGPLIYCVEGVDNQEGPDMALAEQPELAYERRPDLLGGVDTIVGRTVGGGELRAIPYYAWDNRRADDAGRDWMAVWLRQERWVELRADLDGVGRGAWEHELYRPLSEGR